MDSENELVTHILDVLEDMAIPYVIGGSFALCVWATPRTTHDLDVVVELPLARIPEFCARFPADRYYIDEEAMRASFRQAAGPSLGVYSFVDMDSGLKVDLFPLRPGDTFQGGALARRVRAPLLTGQVAAVYTAEDLLVQKLRWYTSSGGGSERQFRDCIELLLADLTRTDRLIDEGRVEISTRQLGPAVYGAWHLLQAAVAQAEGGDSSATLAT